MGVAVTVLARAQEALGGPGGRLDLSGGRVWVERLRDAWARSGLDGGLHGPGRRDGANSGSAPDPSVGKGVGEADTRHALDIRDSAVCFLALTRPTTVTPDREAVTA